MLVLCQHESGIRQRMFYISIMGFIQPLIWSNKSKKKINRGETDHFTFYRQVKRLPSILFYFQSLVDQTGLLAVNNKTQKCKSLIDSGKWSESTEAWGSAQTTVELTSNGVNFYNILKWGALEESAMFKGNFILMIGFICPKYFCNYGNSNIILLKFLYLSKNNTQK